MRRTWRPLLPITVVFLLLSVVSAAPSAARYVDCGNGTVTDTVTGLIWLQNPDCYDYLDWTSATAAAANLANGSCGLTDVAARGDWRLPTQDEWAATIAPALMLRCTGPARPSLTNDAGTACYGDGSLLVIPRTGGP